MNAVFEFWNEQYSVSRPLEVDSWLSRVLNRHVVAALLNTFPFAATRVFSMSRGELAQRLCVGREGGSYRVLRAMYEFNDPGRRGDIINRVFMQSPAVKAARNRRSIAERILEVCLKNQPADLPILVLALGGGDGHIEAGPIARSPRQDVYYCSVDKDDKSIEDHGQVMEQHGLAERSFVFSGDVTEKTDLHAVLEAARERFRVNFDGVRIAACHGIAEYMDIDQPENETLAKMLEAVHDCVSPEGNLIISHTDFHDRVQYMERGLQWKMRLRSMEELEAEIEKAGWQIALCDHEPMRLITMCLAVKSERQHRRIDSPSYIRRPHATRLIRAGSPSVAAAPAR
ncbi:MAG: hypothetical protein GX594_08210 [Pirellulaceae bacterium]|nr:hypothetical protein [Pirellulaceae bacterium]